MDCESWTIKKAEGWKIDAFELWCWRRLLRVPWTARRSNVNPKGNQSWIFIERTDAEAEAPKLSPPDAKSWLIRLSNCKEIKPVNPKGNQSWIVIGKTDAEAETPILWPPDAKNWLLGKDPDARKDWRQEEKGTTEDEMVGWHHQLDGHESEQAPGVGDGQGSLVCCSPWSHRVDTTEQLNWDKLKLCLRRWVRTSWT